MLKAAEEDGYEILISSGYRDRSYQEGLLKEDLAYEKSRGKSQKEAYASVIRETMPPGCSEHETGMAVDLVPYYNQILDERQAETPGKPVAVKPLRGVWVYSPLSEREGSNHHGGL